MVARSAELKRHHRERVIRKRVDIARNIWHAGDTEQDGKIVGYAYNALAKHNLVCSCWMCRGPRYSRDAAKRDVQRAIQEGE